MKRFTIILLLVFLAVFIAFSNEPISGVYSPENKNFDINAIDIRDGQFFILYNNRPYYRLPYLFEIQDAIISVKTIDGLLEFQIVDSKTIVCINGKFSGEKFIKRDG